MNDCGLPKFVHNSDCKAMNFMQEVSLFMQVNKISDGADNADRQNMPGPRLSFESYCHGD